MKVLKFFFWFFIVIIVSATVYYAYNGGFKTIKISEKEIGPYQFAQVEHYGNYKATFKLQDSLSKELKEFDVVCDRAFAIYYDNPKTTTKNTNEYYSIVGLILPNLDSTKIKQLVRAGFNLAKMGKTPCTVTSFPKKSNLSVLLGIFKVYPALNKYRKEKNYKNAPALEIYSKDNILYGMEIKEKEN